MASTIILSDNGASSGSAGLKSTAGNDGVLILQTTTSGGTATNAVYVNDSQYVGFGTNYPTSKVTVNYNSSYAGTPATPTTGASIHLIAADNSSASLSLDTFGNQNGQITFRRSLGTLSSPSALTADTVIGAVTVRGYGATGYATGNRGLMAIYASENWTDTAQGSYITFNTVATGTTTSSESLRINGAGTVILKGGSTSATGVGITFPATQSASTDANTLDDYEEGSWTPEIRTDGGSVYGYTSRGGKYTKVGRMVTLEGYFQRSTSSVSGQFALLYGIPFAIDVVSSSYSTMFGMWASGASGDTLLRNGPTGSIATSAGTFLYMYYINGTTNTLWNPVASTAGDLIAFQVSYLTTA